MYLLPSPPPLARPTVVRFQGRHVFDLLPLVDVYVVQATGALR